MPILPVISTTFVDVAGCNSNFDYGLDEGHSLTLTLVKGETH